ncbi:hypothetical protein [Subtercola frigoramans]|uniref:Uncharacterized protein n=1 Tax=Subtercola frigoramans TaxID=120298 RepID=A0ABS2L4X1_9MICO|nr:hypothetical protein [Subtercola frigoramans]MBM7472098.1 hypothetical protein [Subtercola frigoramans]
MYFDPKDGGLFGLLNDPVLFPKSTYGYACSSADTLLDCTLDPKVSPVKGKINPSIFDLSSEANRGTLLATTTEYGFPIDFNGLPAVIVTAEYDQVRAVAIETYHPSSGRLQDIQGPVRWYNRTTGGFIGTSTHFLSTGDPSSILQAPGAMTVTSFAAPGKVVGLGGAVTYGVTLQATKAGAALVRLTVDGLSHASEASVPTGWVPESSLDSHVLEYLVPYMNAGETRSLSLHFTVSGLLSGVTARVDSQTAVTTSSVIAVVPASPVCTELDGQTPQVPVGGTSTPLTGVICTTEAGTSLLSLFDPENKGTVTLTRQADSSLGGPHSSHSNPVTVTIHVAPAS